jgi:uncharacterized lipoprotein YddW (UPF0748 family)
MPYRKVEAVAMWHRPTVASLTFNGVLYFLNKIKKSGVNLLLVETLWDSYSVYESDILETKSEMVITGNNVFGEYGNDYLKCLITEAHKLGIEVHAWTQTFRGGTASTNTVNDIPKHLKPEWVQKGYQGKYGFDDLGLMYLDPANPEVLTHLKAVYNEMLDKYDWDGVELDYIRYPYSNLVNYSSNSDTSTLRDGGYTVYAENDFLASINKSGSDLKTLIRTDARVREQWSNYRVAKVNNAVKELAKVIKEHDPDLDVSLAVAADHVGGKMNYMCDWMSWINNGWIDTFRPMAYTGDVDAITTFTKRYLGLAHQLSFLQMGIGPGYEGYPAIVNQLQMDTVMGNGGTGCAIFASQNLYNVPEAEEAMALNISRYGKVAPFGDFRTVLKESMNYLEDKMERIYSTAPDFSEKENLEPFHGR